MPTFRKGTFSIDLALAPLVGELADEDRQLAWSLYVDIATRPALRGSPAREDFRDELWTQGLDSLAGFVADARTALQGYPMGRLAKPGSDNLAVFLAQSLELVFVPFVAKWLAPLRDWWHGADTTVPPLERQLGFPAAAELLADWAEVRAFCRDTMVGLSRAYGFVDLLAATPEGLRESWERRET